MVVNSSSKIKEEVDGKVDTIVQKMLPWSTSGVCVIVSVCVCI